MKAALQAAWKKITEEPVVVASAVAQVIAAGVGLKLYDEGVAAAASAAVAAVISFVGLLFARSKVEPLVKQHEPFVPGDLG